MDPRHILLVVSVAVLGALSSGCGSDCTSVCEDIQECPQLQGFNFGAIDCGDACDFQEDFADSRGCVDQFDAYYACGAESDDICTETGCLEESRAFNECMSGDDDDSSM
jgi:hypothetical protein